MECRLVCKQWRTVLDKLTDWHARIVSFSLKKSECKTILQETVGLPNRRSTYYLQKRLFEKFNTAIKKMVDEVMMLNKLCMLSSFRQLCTSELSALLHLWPGERVTCKIILRPERSSFTKKWFVASIVKGSLPEAVDIFSYWPRGIPYWCELFVVKPHIDHTGFYWSSRSSSTTAVISIEKATMDISSIIKDV